MGKYLDKEGVDKLWNKTKKLVEESGTDKGGVSWGKIKSWNNTTHEDVGKVVLVNNTTLKKITISSDDLEQYKDTHTPIGVIVIPKSHDVYGTGEGAMIAITCMDYNNPDEGGAARSMYWGPTTRVSVLGEYQYAPIIDDINSINPTIVSQTNTPYLPSDKFTSNICAHDNKAGYYNTNAPAPSPYLNNGSKNPLYYSTQSPSSSNNCLSDFDGKDNSKKILDLATTQTNWKTDSTITNSNNTGYYPAFCCCWRYHTIGTNQGDWYLPSCGELGYAFARQTVINKAINEIKSIWNKTVSLVSSEVWSSTNYGRDSISEYDVRIINFSNGGISFRMKSYSFKVYAFCRI